MKSRFLPLLLALLASYGLSAQIIITEISYNPPETMDDSLEYVEIYNTSDNAIDLTGYRIDDAVKINNLGFTLPAKSYGLVAKKISAVQAVFGISADAQWSSGSLTNGGETITILDAAGTEIFSVTYSDRGEWPSEALGTDGAGASIELCALDRDATLGANWRVSPAGSGVTINGREVKGTPQAANAAVCEIIPDHTVNTDGLKFVPEDITINIGETVRWVNNGGVHNVNASQDAYPDNPEGFSSGAPSGDSWTFDHTFVVAGLYRYQCDPHLNFGMVGSVKVVDPNAPVSKVVVSEIMYNDPSAGDDLEFIELYNNEDATVDLTGWKLSGVVTHTFGDVSIASKGTVLLAKNPAAFQSTFAMSAIEWDGGTLENVASLLALSDADGKVADEFSYQVDGPYGAEANGNGPSLVRCNLLGEGDAFNWTAASGDDYTYEGNTVLANPGSVPPCELSISTVRTIDQDGIALFNGANVVLQGVVHSPNFESSRLSFAMIDDSGVGITVFSPNNFGYSPSEGDVLRVPGRISQFNGLTQIVADTIEENGVASLVDPIEVNLLSEETESQLIVIKNVSLANSGQWSNTGGGFNVELTDGTNTYMMRVDRDTDIYGKNPPSGTFDVTGIGSQFDTSDPRTSGYQILPRYVADINPYNETTVSYKPTSIVDIRQNNADGESLLLDSLVEVSGVVSTINYRSGGLQFWISDANNKGLNVFSFDPVSDYEVTMGDEISIKGRIIQFRGLTEVSPDEITLESQGNDLPVPNDVSSLDESVESTIVKIRGSLMDPAQWMTDGSSFAFDVDANGETISVFIDSDSELAGTDAPAGFFSVTGVVNQRDEDAPYDEGYSLLPRVLGDIEIINTVNEVELSATIFPNPASTALHVDLDGELEAYEIYHMDGRKVAQGNAHSTTIDVSSLSTGQYMLRLLAREGTATKTFYKK